MKDQTKVFQWEAKSHLDRNNNFGNREHGHGRKWLQDELIEYDFRFTKRKGTCDQAALKYVVDMFKMEHKCGGFEAPIPLSWEVNAMIGGATVEQTKELVERANEELKKAKKELEATVNEMRTIRDVLMPDMNKFIEELIAKRMTLNRELNEVMSGMREVRKFFIAREYNEEKQRLEEFAGLCERLWALKRSGFIDAMFDGMLKLAGEENRNGRK
jgi:hypothetical protein